MKEPNLLYDITNWWCKIKIYSDGTKERRWSDPEYPECIDLKITNYCDAWCAWCHEKSTVEGKHASLDNIYNILRDAPAWTEFALGGGNPLDHPDLIDILSMMKGSDLITNLTVNAVHLGRYKSLLDKIIKEGLVFWLGISYNKFFKDQIKQFDYEHKVVHMIAWVNSFEEIRDVVLANKKVLILGYKTRWRGEQYFSEIVRLKIEKTKWYLPYLIGFGMLCFDNLGVEQLGPQRFFTDKNWGKMYMWDDGQHTMYIDAVTNTYAMTSFAKERNNFITLKQSFDDVRSQRVSVWD